MKMATAMDGTRTNHKEYFPKKTPIRAIIAVVELIYVRRNMAETCYQNYTTPTSYRSSSV